ncbi:hypothetical protein BC938DRAFT_473498 [Jimgerdemannia flammicorona]|uniref:Uncharacterized protein n=1 Tax=Jimgerdemannia flammicorona TaxID=994334 RepID=A0A433Q3Z4_9FUNG|nr:hypothetical protein BC938DRAFT_473498 [Jimgerdemannia flammicorona]
MVRVDKFCGVQAQVALHPSVLEFIKAGDANGSQFFIDRSTFRVSPEHNSSQNVVFGYRSLKVVDKIRGKDT